jgi:lipooligosaccharide transport system permease protein
MTKIWYRNVLFFKKTFLVSFFWTILEPLMYLGGFGLGFGRYVPPVEQLPYLEFYFPGLICTTIMMVSYFEATYPNFSKLNYQRIYTTILMTRVTISDIWFGEALWGTSKALLSAIGLVVVGAFFGLFSIKLIFLIPVLVLLGWIFSAFGLVMISVAKSYDTFVYSTSGLIVPLSLFSGTFFSLNDVPQVIRTVAYLFPLSHAVEISRSVLHREVNSSLVLHFCVLIAYAVGLTFLSLRLFNKRLST